jgi:hypothetical protein
MSILTSILGDAFGILELHTMWEKGTLPTTISTEYDELLELFEETREPICIGGD